MDDTIYRQAAIDAVNSIARTDNWKAAVNMLLIDLPSAQQWTPCSEGTPKKTDYYICTCHDGAYYRTSVLKWVTGWVLTGARSYWRVIAWMPLPKPYREGRME